MANYITIGVVAPAYLTVDEALPPRQVVERMIAYLREKVAQVLPVKPDLIVLPEICDQPANYHGARAVDYFRTRGSQVRDALAELAAEYSSYLVYSSRWEEPDGSWRNSSFLLDRRGQVISRYNKMHLVVEENTEGGMRYGKGAVVAECDFGRVGFAICFDLNFDDLRLQYQALQPDLLLFSSVFHGGLMQANWAFSCRTHFVGAVADRPSAIISPIGQILASTTNYYDFVTARVNLDCCVAHLDYNWGRFEAARKKYGAGVTINDPGYLASVLLSSERDDLTVKELVQEFDIELLDDYLARVQAHRLEPGRIEA